MKRFFSVILTFILIFAMLLSVCSCSTSVGRGNQSVQEEKRSFVLQHNNLWSEPEVYKKSAEGWTEQQYLKINGLKDQKIQDSINKKIEDSFMEAVAWKEYPKYRGLMLELKKWEGMEPYSSYVNTTTYCNVGNILSVVTERQLNYEKAGDTYSWLYLSELIPLNFDLNTGEQIKITDVFRDGVDGLEYINDFIYDRINNTNASEEDESWTDGWSAFKLAGEFTGVTEDQKFYISSEGDYLMLVLDDDTPWVKLSGFSPSYITVPIGEVSALDKKFINGNIYTDESVNFVLVANNYDSDTMGYLQPDEASEYKGINNLIYSNNMVYYPEMPDYMIEAEKAFAQESQQEIDAFVEEYGLPYKSNPQYTGWVTLSSSVSRYGEYTSIAMSLYADAQLVDEDWNYKELGRISKNKHLLYKEGIERPLTAADIFADGYDYQHKLGINDSYGFQLMGDTLYAISDSDFQNFAYSKIGCENLKIFER